MTQSNIKILLVLLAAVMVGGVYIYVFKPNMDDKDSLKSETESLEVQLADLQVKEANRAQYEEEKKQYYAAVEEQLGNYPATLDQEISVMFVKGLEEVRKDEFTVNSVGLGKPESFYTLSNGYECFSAAFPIAYVGTYEGIKEIVKYVMDYKYRMNVSSLNIAYDSSTGECSGAINLNAFSVYGEDREADTVNVDVPTGVDCIFEGGNGAPSSQAFAYDTDNGAAIKSDNNVKILLNDANNDTADGIIVSSGGSSTYVTSSDNSTVNLTIKVVNEDGKNYVYYSIGDSEQKTEITGTDVKVFVDSSERVNSDDKNQVKVTVDNKTELPVFFKVDGDDATQPRFVLGSKSGTVKVYK